MERTDKKEIGLENEQIVTVISLSYELKRTWELPFLTILWYVVCTREGPAATNLTWLAP